MVFYVLFFRFCGQSMGYLEIPEQTVENADRNQFHLSVKIQDTGVVYVKDVARMPR